MPLLSSFCWSLACGLHGVEQRVVALAAVAAVLVALLLQLQLGLRQLLQLLPQGISPAVMLFQLRLMLRHIRRRLVVACPALLRQLVPFRPVGHHVRLHPSDPPRCASPVLLGTQRRLCRLFSLTACASRLVARSDRSDRSACPACCGAGGGHSSAASMAACCSAAFCGCPSPGCRYPPARAP